MTQEPRAIDCKLLIVGATGRMGEELVASVRRRNEAGERHVVLGGIAAASDPAIGTRIDGIAEPISASWTGAFAPTEVIIDFSSAEGALKAASFAREHSVALLSCSTGLNADQEAQIASVSKHVPVIRTRNTSVGVTALQQLVGAAARMLDASFEIELVELHHRHKADAPSGTALALLEEAAAARNTPLDTVLSSGRSGVHLTRERSEIGAQAVRGGDIAGEHTVYFISEGERIELTHRATNRRIFADGAIRAALWLVQHRRAGRGPGLFSMKDVLG